MDDPRLREVAGQVLEFLVDDLRKLDVGTRGGEQRALAAVDVREADAAVPAFAPPDEGAVDTEQLELLEARDAGDTHPTGDAHVTEPETDRHLGQSEDRIPGRAAEGHIHRGRAGLLERCVDRALADERLGAPLERGGCRAGDRRDPSPQAVVGAGLRAARSAGDVVEVQRADPDHVQTEACRSHASRSPTGETASIKTIARMFTLETLW